MAAGTIERITVVLQSLTAGFARGLGKAQTQLKTVGKNMQNFGAVMQMPMNNFKELNGSFKVMKNTGGRVARTFRLMTHGMRGFRMEALGVMFFGMMMQRMFMGLLQPVMEAFGVFDIFRLMLLTLFLPIMEMIFPFLMSLMEWFMDLPEPIKKAIGIFVILGAIFGLIIMALGQFALGIGSLILFFPIFGTAIKAVGAFLIGLSATALAVIAAIIVVVIGMFIAWKENFMNMKQVVSDLWQGIKFIFQGIYDVIVGVVRLITGIMKGDFSQVKDAIKQILQGLATAIFGIFISIGNFIGAIGIGIIRVFWGIVKAIVGFFVWLYNKIVGRSIIPDMIKAIIAWFWKLPKAIFDMFRSIVRGMFNVGKNIMQKMIDGIKSLGRKVINAILSLFPAWMRKGIESTGKIVINIVKSITEKVSGAFGGGSKDDFIWRPGQAPVSINPNDTLVGFKGESPGLGGGANITQENHFHGFTMEDLKRELDSRDRRLVDDVRRLVKE